MPSVETGKEIKSTSNLAPVGENIMNKRQRTDNPSNEYVPNVPLNPMYGPVPFAYQNEMMPPFCFPPLNMMVNHKIIKLLHKIDKKSLSWV